MKTIAIESPLGVGTPEFERNLRYLAWCVRYVYELGHAAYAGHGLGPCAAGESPDCREHGLQADKAFRDLCHEVWFFDDIGWSAGMMRARLECALGKAITRTLPIGYLEAFRRGEWPPGATVRWVPADPAAVSPDWSDPIEDDVLEALQFVIRAQLTLVESEGDQEQIRRLDRAREELDEFASRWRA